jgi:hypothetical protein
VLLFEIRLLFLEEKMGYEEKKEISGRTAVLGILAVIFIVIPALARFACFVAWHSYSYRLDKLHSIYGLDTAVIDQALRFASNGDCPKSRPLWTAFTCDFSLRAVELKLGLGSVEFAKEYLASHYISDQTANEMRQIFLEKQVPLLLEELQKEAFIRNLTDTALDYK